jgi:hypothetical protein
MEFLRDTRSDTRKNSMIGVPGEYGNHRSIG